MTFQRNMYYKSIYFESLTAKFLSSKEPLCDCVGPRCMEGVSEYVVPFFGRKSRYEVTMTRSRLYFGSQERYSSAQE